MTRNLIELLAALGVAVVFAALLAEAAGYPGQSRVMPVAVCGLAVMLALVWAAQSGRALSRGTPRENFGNWGEMRRLAVIVAAIVLYTLAVGSLGFFTATIAMLPALSGALGYRNWKVLIPVTLCFAGVLYAVFRLLLSVPLPPETLIRLMG
ncbi:tripartite tricarboxylate transporter TctB family protein [Roseivivax sp. CAU 1761]